MSEEDQQPLYWVRIRYNCGLELHEDEYECDWIRLEAFGVEMWNPTKKEWAKPCAKLRRVIPWRDIALVEYGELE